MEEQKQKRMTRQKRLVYAVLCASREHPTAEQIYVEAKKQLPEISLGTVHRNLQVLRDEGKVLELDYGKCQSRFDGDTRQHYHFVCQRCGRVLDFPEQGPQVADSVLAAAPGRVDGYRLECYGVCQDCLCPADVL